MSYTDSKPLVKVELPSDPNYYVNIETDLTYGDIKRSGISGDLTGTAAADAALLLSIKDWNLDDAEGNILPITQESIDLLKQADILAISTAINGGAGDAAEKKDLPQ